MRQKTRDIDPTHKDVLKFWTHVQKSDGCWTWTGAKNSKGYGATQAGGKCTFAHRFSWRLHHGVIPDGLVICHKCDNPPCVRPDHLFAGTHQENSQDASKKGRLAKPRRKLTTSQIDELAEMVRTGTTHAKAGWHLGITADQVRRVLELRKDAARRAPP